MGSVYAAFDGERAEHVALKLLDRVDAQGIHDIKNEFRNLTTLTHANVVRLHELFGDELGWYFSMELVPGQPFDRWVRPPSELQEARLRAAISQLSAALVAVHSAGKLHRDLKPSNVLVTREGRVVVLDFGLSTGGLPGASLTLSHDGIAGTPSYMAPEQVTGGEVTPKSDLYAVGVMLFEALTGRLPFEGMLAEVLSAKSQRAAPSASALVPDLPRDLVAWCARLLALDPNGRPTAAELMAAFAATRPVATTPAPAPAPEGVQLTGRARELEILTQAFEGTLRGGAEIVAVHGESGIGKTTLCEGFLESVRARGDTVILAGRCYENESVPFKALDALIDQLGRYLRRLSSLEAAALMPRHVFALARLFPVLQRVDAIYAAPTQPIPEPNELRRLGFAALGELLARIRDRHPVVVYIDDLQWTDRDSVAFLRHLLTYRAPAPVLFIVSHRDEAAGSDALVAQVFDSAVTNPALHAQHLQLGPLTPEQSNELVRRMFEHTSEYSLPLCERIARESGGNPFLATELVRIAGAGAPEDLPLLSEVVSYRMQSLSETARRLLSVVAVAAVPLPSDVALEAAAAPHTDLDLLRAALLLRRSASDDGLLVECYHDRIREAVVTESSVTAVRASWEGLAQALTRRDRPDLELLSRCCENAGDRVAAARSARLAADRAAAAFAFERAAELYRRVLSLETEGDAQVELLGRLGLALENAGRGREAANVYLQAATTSRGEASLELERRAAEQLLLTGHVEEGTLLAQDICRRISLRFAQSTPRAVGWLAWTQLMLRVRGLDSTPRRRHATSDFRLQTARMLASALIGQLPVQAASIAAEYLKMALNAGDPPHLVRALGLNAYLGTVLNRSASWPNELLSRMDSVATRSGDCALIAYSMLIRGAAAHTWDQFKQGSELLGRGRELLRQSPGNSWEIDMAHILEQMCACGSGDYAMIVRTTPVLIDEALRRNRVYTAAMLSGVRGAPAWLTLDDAAGYARQLREAKRFWKPHTEPRWPDHFLLMGDAWLSLYSGEPERGYALLEDQRASHSRSMLVHAAIQARALSLTRFAACAASALRGPNAARSRRRRDWYATVKSSIGPLKNYGGPVTTCMALNLEAVLALEADHREQAVSRLRAALQIEVDAGLEMIAAATRRRLGVLVGGDEGRGLVEDGEAYMAAQGVRNISAMTELLCPGCRPE